MNAVDASFARAASRRNGKAPSRLIERLAPEHSSADLEAEARRNGVGLLDALMVHPDIEQRAVLDALGASLGVAVEREAPRFHGGVRLSAESARAALRTGILFLPDGRLLICARGYAMARAVALLRSDRAALARIVVAGPQVFSDCVLALAGEDLARHASASIEAVDPSLSARRAGFGKAAAGLVAVLAVVAVAIAANLAAILELLIILCFLLCTVLRLCALFAPSVRHPPLLSRIDPRELPVYSVLVPLYREAASVRGLVAALADLDYPAVKLDIRLLVENDDDETLHAIDRCGLPPHFEVMRLPPGEPRTKPRALTVGLAAARGQYVVVYDAEDRPEPGQLRAALALFEADTARLACVQARLTIDNTADNWLTRMFTIEYAGLFDALLPGLSRLRMMFPLGGTSNHFRTAALDRSGGWDAWNVTEDADLGVRLARLGLRTQMLDSTTFEEAPNRTRAWLKQRTRWMKGYILTWAVHMRHPVRLWRELGARDFFAFHAIIGGVPLSALLLPLFLAYMGWQIASGTWLSGTGLLSWALPGLAMANLVLGFATAIAVSAAGIDNRRLWALQPLLILSPLYWLLGSAAAWRAVLQLICDPHVWEKTEHGLARTSRSPAAASPNVDLAGART